MTLLLRSERQRYAVRPPEPVLRRVLSAARAPRQVGHVVLFRHLTRRAIGLPVQGQPTAAGGSGQVGAAVAANPIDRQPFQGRPSVGDRKSTRLNSSHITISYAVFCLKKKSYAISFTSDSSTYRNIQLLSPIISSRSFPSSPRLLSLSTSSTPPPTIAHVNAFLPPPHP